MSVLLPAERVVHALIERGWHISFAESCTGGLLADKIVSVPDASHVLSASFITYSEDAKMRYASVSAETLKTYGVVSEQVAGEMAAGAAAAAGAEVGVGVTGIAGPAGGTKELPVGTVCIGYSMNGALLTETFHSSCQERNEIREHAALHALNALYFHLISPTS